MAGKRVLILQNQIGRDGRSRVTGQLISLINRHGLVPELATLSQRGRIEAFFDDQGEQIRVRVARRWFPTGRGYVAQVLLHNILSRRTVAQADLVVNMNDNFYFLPLGPRYLHYINDPLEEHFGRARELGFHPWAVYARACQLLARGSSIRSEGVVLVNSAFTRGRLARVHPEPAARAHVVFPPCVSQYRMAIEESPKRHDVVSVGTFSRGKGQLDVLQLAERNRDLRFVLVGSVWDRRYAQRCLDFTRARHLANAELVLNAGRPRLEAILDGSRVYLHLKADEGFGISTVEAMARGCVPLVPDSGGQREVVPLPELRYPLGSDIGAQLRRLVRLDTATRQGYVRALRSHAANFSVEMFRYRVARFLAPLLDEGCRGDESSGEEIPQNSRGCCGT
jgi:glycosyltransferase involved in cell wall biosynthesis